MAGFEKDVVGLHVSVEDVVFVQGFKCVDDLFENSKGLFFGYFASLADQIFERALVAVFVDKVDVVVGFDHLDKVDDVDVVFEEFEDFDLVFGELGEFVNLLEFFEGDHFDSDVDFGVDVGGLVDFAVLALAQIIS